VPFSISNGGNGLREGSGTLKIHPMNLDDKEESVASAWAAEIARRAADAIANPDDEEDWRTALIEIQQDVLAQ
jgi:hypothetical protein